MDDILRSEYLPIKCLFLGKDHEGRQLTNMRSHHELHEFLHLFSYFSLPIYQSLTRFWNLILKDTVNSS